MHLPHSGMLSTQKPQKPPKAKPGVFEAFDNGLTSASIAIRESGGIIKVQGGTPADSFKKGMIPPQAHIVRHTLVDTRSVKGMVPPGMKNADHVKEESRV